MQKLHDSLGRRCRTQSQSSGKRIRPTARDLAWFAALAEHGPLPSSYLLSSTKSQFSSDKRAKERLTDLFNEANTPHGGAYLSRPVQQFRTLDSRYNQLVYDLTCASQAVLREQDDMARPVAQRSGPWVHQLMVSCITASIALASANRPDLRYLSQSFLLERAKGDLRFDLPPSSHGHGQYQTLVPDALFGLEYCTPEGTRYRCFVIEADRSTEPATSSSARRKSWQRSLLQYEAYIGEGHYRTHLKLKAPLMLLIVVPDQKRAEQLLRLIPKVAPRIAQQVLVQTWPAFGHVFKPPTPNPALLDGEWMRPDRPGFRIDRI